jgi:hypothetical protein
MKRNAEVVALALLAAACGLSTGPGPPGEDEAQQVELGHGEEITIPGTELRVAFLGIQQDSRCPVDVTCVWEGDAAVEIGLTAGSGPTQLRVLHTALEPKAVDFEGVRVTLVAVAPEPREGEPIPAGNYVVTLRLEPIGP